MIVTTTRKKCMEEYVRDKGLRKRYYLYHCPTFMRDGKLQTHLFDLDTPRNAGKSRMEYYGMHVGYQFAGRERGERVALRLVCVFCLRRHFTTPRICRKCGKAQKPITRKMADRLILGDSISCNCHAEGKK